MKKFLLTLLAATLLNAYADNAPKRTRSAAAIPAAAAAQPATMEKTLSASYDPQDGSTADFYMLFSDKKDATWSKEDGPKVKDGYVLRLDCYAPLSERPIVLAEGTYTPSTSCASMTYDPTYSFLQYYDADGNAGSEYNLSGNLTVSRNSQGTYTLTVGIDGGTTATVVSEIAFDDGTMPPGVFTQIKKNLDLSLNGALAIYDGNLYQSNTGSMYINLYDHAFDSETGGMTEDGFSLALQVFGKLFADSKTATLDPGTYTVGRSFKRYTFYPGTEIEYMGMTGLMGCYAKERNPGLYSDGYAYSYLTDGTIVIDDLGDGVFRITVDATTSYGHSVKGVFEGTVPVHDQSDDKGSTAISTLEDDVELDLSPIPCCRIFNSGDVNGCQVFTLDIGSPAGRDDITEGDIMRLEFVLPKGTKHLSEGTYTVMEGKYENSYEPYKLGKGRFVSTSGGGTDLSGTRYMHFEEGRNLIMDHYAPADEGTVSVTKNADDTWTFSIHIIDDAQFRIDGEWTGPMILMYDPEGITGIANTVADGGEIAVERIDGATFRLTGTGVPDASAPIEVYNLQGQRTGATVSGNVITLAAEPAGLYIAKYKSHSFKLLKK